MAHNLCGDILEHPDLLGSQRDDRSHNDALAGMDAERIKILHRHNRETEVRSITDHLKLDFFPTLERLFNQDLTRIGQRAFAMSTEFLVIGADA